MRLIVSVDAVYGGRVNSTNPQNGTLLGTSVNDLAQAKFLILDCQTTGMRPSVGSLLEFSWAWASAACPDVVASGGLIELPPGGSIPNAVRDITGIRLSDLEGATSLDDMREAFVSSLAGYGTEARAVALIHYAQFEEAWLRDLLACAELPFDVVCTHKISKKLFPNVPSRNIRALTGYLGVRIGDVKRAPQHVLATQKIWQGLVPALAQLGVTTLSDLRTWLAEKPAKASRAARGSASVAAPAKKPAYDYLVAREKRLALPAKPGIYKMIAKSGEILYVGKATSLKDRVNSYFRGKKGRDPRKLEMMAQVWDLEVIECGSAIEAALIESDEIKRLNPPYNVSLKEGNRALLYYDRALTTESLVQSTDHPVGPFRRFNALEHMRIFGEGLREDLIRNVFYQPIENSLLEQAYVEFEARYPEFTPETMTTRDHLAFAISLRRRGVQAEDETQAEDASRGDVIEAAPSGLREALASLVIVGETELEEELTVEDVVEKIERVYLRAASTYLRAKKLTKLLFSDVRWTEKGETKSLKVRGGKLGIEAEVASRETPWKDLTVSDYDRMSVLLMEISKVEHEISPIR